ncbi:MULTISPECIES: hypothetical protein [unclassified Achromobacter]|uniref:hypothetical protein n=1 Tax=unclassified Achromobacter TaxID=2626865 RepID=UPI000B51AB90|nr:MULTISPECIES: hypothetical protein [unclassified Achromobacter]OWT80247.1 hypothetical protein CEY05_02195 [Achromobacter sp. HZ34]OWT82130.1 hypothetical protein CEY04_02195 [Achromobacter sp. HZ28]
MHGRLQVPDFSEIQRQLKAHRLRVTLARLEVLDALHRVKKKVITRDDLLLLLGRLGYDTSLPRMNRALRDLVRVGLVLCQVREDYPTTFRLMPFVVRVSTTL